MPKGLFAIAKNKSLQHLSGCTPITGNKRYLPVISTSARSRTELQDRLPILPSLLHVTSCIHVHSGVLAFACDLRSTD